MQNESASDAKRIWQDQLTKPSSTTLKLIRRRAEDLHAKTRRQLWGSWVGPLVVGAFSAYGIQLVHGVFPALEVAFAIAVVWSLAGVYFINRGLWSAAMPGDAALSSGLEYYRREIERRRAFYGRGLLWSFGPIVLATVTFILFLALVSQGKSFLNGLPFLALIVIWIAAYFFIRLRELRELKRDVDEEVENEKR